MRRKDPAEGPIDGTPDWSAVEGKAPDSFYKWATREELPKLLASRVYETGAGRKVAVEPFVICKQGEEAEFAGYGSVRGGEPVGAEITNGELVLVKRPVAEQEKVWALNEQDNKVFDEAIYGSVKGTPIKVENEQVVRK